ncbi:hypothetical protein TeGR_g1735, partial [Tetraparma gracilis]
GLVELKADTILGFSDFNRSKRAMEQEGAWAFETNRQRAKRLEREAKALGSSADPAAGHGTGQEGVVRKKLVVRRIFDEQRRWDMAHSVIDFGQKIDWSGSAGAGDDGGGGLDKSAKHKGCKWRGENEEGVDHMCNNAKLVHPWKTYKDEFGAEVPEQISFCHFHAKFCLDPRKAHGDHLVKIKEPNEFALCNECYVVQKKRPPPSLAKFRIPGVTRAARAGGGGGGGIKASKDPSGDALNEDTVCDWKPNRMLIEERGLSCHNKPPKKIELPLPGMEKREKEEVVEMSIEDQMKHFLRPFGIGPEMEDPPVEYFEPRPPKGWRDRWRRNTKRRAHEVKVKGVGPLYAGRIQRNWRMWSCQKEADRLRKEEAAVRRHNAAVRIQAIARRYIMKEEVEELKKSTVGAINLVSRLIRGLLARKKVKRIKAARVLQRGGLRAVAGALMYAVKSTLEVRHEHEHEEWGNLTLQRYAKGFVTRLRVKQRREQVRLETISALLMQRIYRGRIGRRRFDHLFRQKLWEDSNASVIQSAMRRVLATAYVQHRRVTWNAAAVVIQRRGHVYAAQMMALHERESIQKFWDWLAPTLPRDAFVDLLPRTYYGAHRFNVDPKIVMRMNMAERAQYFKELAAQVAYEQSLADSVASSDGGVATKMMAGEQFFRKYDPDGIGQVSRMDFGFALGDMWETAGCPLLNKEVKALVARFDHHNDGWIDYFRFLRFAASHEKPCAVHGRLICADCISFGKCIRHGVVICKKFRPSVSSNNVCKCGAYISAHEMIPEPNNDEEYDTGYISKEQMDSIFKKEKKPDLEKPARGGEGVQLGDVLGMSRYDIEHDMEVYNRQLILAGAPPTQPGMGSRFVNPGMNANVCLPAIPSSEEKKEFEEAGEEKKEQLTPTKARSPTKSGGLGGVAFKGVSMKQILNAPNPDAQSPAKARTRTMSSPKKAGSSRSLKLNLRDAQGADEEEPLDPEEGGRKRAMTMERTEEAQAPDDMLFKRQPLHDETKHVTTLPNRDQHWHSISKNQYQALGHLVPSQHAP